MVNSFLPFVGFFLNEEFCFLSVFSVYRFAFFLVGIRYSSKNLFSVVLNDFILCLFQNNHK